MFRSHPCLIHRKSSILKDNYLILVIYCFLYLCPTILLCVSFKLPLQTTLLTLSGSLLSCYLRFFGVFLVLGVFWFLEKGSAVWFKTLLSLREAKPWQRSKTAQSCSSFELPSKELSILLSKKMHSTSLMHLPSALYPFLQMNGHRLP